MELNSGNNNVTMDISQISEEPQAKSPQGNLLVKKQKKTGNPQTNLKNPAKADLSEQQKNSMLKRQKSTEKAQHNKKDDNSPMVDRGEGFSIKSFDQLNSMRIGGKNSSSLDSFEECRTPKNLNKAILEKISLDPQTSLLKNPKSQLNGEEPEKPLDQRVDIVVEEKNSIFGSKEDGLKNPVRYSDKIDVSFLKFLWSFVKKQPEVEIIKRAEKALIDSMDIAVLSKKCSDLEKLKVLLLTPQERAIFDNLPTSVLAVSPAGGKSSKIFVNYSEWEKSMKGNMQKVQDAYASLKNQKQKSELQRKLLGLYESQHLQDFFC